MTFNKDGSMTFMCMMCHNLINVSGLVNPRYSKRYGIVATPFYSLEKCPHCKETGEELCVNIDEEIAEDIAVLNKKGYETMFCCSSHSEKDPLMYVVFSYAQDFEGIDPPEDFYFDTTDSYNEGVITLRIKESCVIKDYETNLFRIPEEINTLPHNEWKKRHKKHLKEFHQWVQDLKPFPGDNTPVKIKHLHVKPL